MNAAVHVACGWWLPAELDGRPVVAPVVVGCTVTGSTEAAGHPATAVLDVAHPYRTWRSTTVATDQTLTCDLGVPQPLAGAFVHRPNVASLQLHASADGSAWTLLDTVTVDRDRRVGRRKRWCRLATFCHRYLRVTMVTATRDAGATYLELGALALCYPALWLADGIVAPLRYGRRGGVADLELLGGGVEHAEAGPAWLEAVLAPQGRRGGRRMSSAAAGPEGEYGWGTTGFGTGGWMAGQYGGAAVTGGSPAPNRLVAERIFGALAAIPIGQAFVLTDAHGAPERAALVRRVRPDQVDETFALLEGGDFWMQEAV